MSLKLYARIKNSELQQGYALDEKAFEYTKAEYPDEVFIEVDVLVSPERYYFKDGIVKQKPAKPSETYFWDSTTLSWIESPQLKELEVKARRNELLLSSDWTQLPDIPTATKEAWAQYRQELRDITLQSGYPLEVVWPVPPQ